MLRITDLKKPFLSCSEKIQSISLLFKMNYIARIDVHMIFLKSKLNYYCMAALPQKRGSYYLSLPSHKQISFCKSIGKVHRIIWYSRAYQKKRVTQIFHLHLLKATCLWLKINRWRLVLKLFNRKKASYEQLNQCLLFFSFTVDAVRNPDHSCKCWITLSSGRWLPLCLLPDKESHLF